MKLTPEQESLIGDDVYHEKKIEEDIVKSAKVTGRIPIGQDKLDQILINVGRKKHANTTHSKTTRKGERQDTAGDVGETEKAKLGLG